jgi:hypothetical protein
MLDLETTRQAGDLVIGGLLGGGLVLILLRGLLSLLTKWKELVVTYEIQNKNLRTENAQLNSIVDDQRKLLDEANHQILVYERENEVLTRRIEQMAVEIIDLKAEFYRLAQSIGAQNVKSPESP